MADTGRDFCAERNFGFFNFAWRGFPLTIAGMTKVAQVTRFAHLQNLCCEWISPLQGVTLILPMKEDQDRAKPCMALEKKMLSKIHKYVNISANFRDWDMIHICLQLVP